MINLTRTRANMPRFNALEKHVVAALSALDRPLRRLKPSHGNWTRKVAGQIASAGMKQGFIPSGHGCAQREFMYDIVWTRRRRDGSIIDVPLVMECEWGNT